MHWILHIQGGPKRVNHAAVAIDNKIYTFGGYCSDEGLHLPNKIDVYVFHTESLRWRPVHYFNSFGLNVPRMVFGHTVIAYQRNIYLWGGRNNFSAYNTLYCFNIDQLEWSIPETSGMPPPALDGHTACVIDSYMYIFGGFEEVTESFMHNTYRIHLNSFKWEKVYTKGTPPSPRDFHTATVVGNRMYIFGGRSIDDDDEDYYDNTMKYLDTNTSTWVTPASNGIVPLGRRSHTSVVYNNELYIVGGYCSSYQLHLNDINKYVPSTGTWSRISARGNYPEARRRHVACVVGDTMYLFGGSKPTAAKYENEINGNNDTTLLIEQSDLVMFDFFPSLKRLSQVIVIENNLDYTELPILLKEEIKSIICSNMKKPHSAKNYS